MNRIVHTNARDTVGIPNESDNDIIIISIKQVKFGNLKLEENVRAHNSYNALGTTLESYVR